MSSLDRLYALPNMQDYLDAVYSLDSDRHRSLGALAVDIPGFLQIKEQKGYEYGTRFLLRVSEVLMDVFGHSLLFHTREAEFITLCTDVTYDAFLNLCARAKQLVGGSTPACSASAAPGRMGFSEARTWSIKPGRL